MDEIDKIIINNLPSHFASAFVSYPRHIANRRAFIYALLCGDNQNKINQNEFLAACYKYGLDNPCPSVTKRLSLYGNDEDVEEYLKKELMRFNIS
jgi:hypothetical protein